MPRKGFCWKTPMWRMSDGKSVMQFCRENKVTYTCVMAYIEKGLSVDEACKKALERKGRKDSASIYFIGDMSLHKWCRENNENYQMLRKQILKRIQYNA